MRKYLALCGALLCSSVAIIAQDRVGNTSATGQSRRPSAKDSRGPYGSGSLPPWQVAGSYEYVRFKIAGSALNLNGFHTSYVRFANEWFGLEGAVGGSFGGTSSNERAKLLIYGAGPRIAYRHNTKIEPWVHALFGGAHLLPQTSLGDDHAFAYAAGGGVDFKINPLLFWRAQADYLESRFFNRTQRNCRVMTGLALSF